jgi:putative spermidine/putrescine transport system permease protein
MIARVLRGSLLGKLLLSAVGPVLLLAIASIGREWFFPSLAPPVFSFDAWSALVRGAPLVRAAAASVTLATVTGAVAAVCALPIGRALARLRGWTSITGTALAFLPLAIPPIAIATGLTYALVRAGLGGTWSGVLLGHLVPALGVLALYYRGVFTALDTGFEDEARSLGASPRQVWLRVLVPILSRPIAAGWALGFLFSWAQVALTLLIGGGRVHTLALEVFDSLRSGQDRFAATGALLLILPAILVLLVVGRAGRKVIL